MQSDKKKGSVSRTSRLGSAKLDYDENFSDRDHEGILWMKTCVKFRNIYVPTWCTLKDKLFTVYDKKDGTILDNINIEVCRITPFIKRGSLNFYFRIINDWSECSFGIKTEKEYGVWINRLQYIASYNTIENGLYQNNVVKQFSRDEYTSSNDKSDFIDKSNLTQSLLTEIDDKYVYDTETNDDEGKNHVGNPEKNKLLSVTSTDDVFIENVNVRNLSTINTCTDNIDTSDIDKFKLMRYLEREIRDKSLWLSKIDDILRKAHLPDEIDLFFEDYHTQLLQ